jgi:hypothetical protein
VADLSDVKIADMATFIEQTILADKAESDRTDDARRLDRLSGLRCACCDAPLPAGHAGPECAECASIDF